MSGWNLCYLCDGTDIVITKGTPLDKLMDLIETNENLWKIRSFFAITKLGQFKHIDKKNICAKHLFYGYKRKRPKKTRTIQVLKHIQVLAKINFHSAMHSILIITEWGTPLMPWITRLSVRQLEGHLWKNRLTLSNRFADIPSVLTIYRSPFIYLSCWPRCAL